MSKEGMRELVFFFDTETLEFVFDEADTELLSEIYMGSAQDIPEMAEYKQEQDDGAVLY